MTEIHHELLAAVHEQVLVVDTLTVPVPALESTGWLVGEMEYAQEGGAGGGGGGGGGAGGGGVAGAACVTVNARPPIVSVPVRAGPTFVPTLNPTDPFPFPLAPDVTVSHAALVTAVHPHPAWVDTATVPAPADASALRLLDEIVNVHDAVAAACVTSARCPPIVMLPVRSLPALDATVNRSVLLPLSDIGSESLIQPASVVAVHAHSLEVVTVTLPESAPAFSR